MSSPHNQSASPARVAAWKRLSRLRHGLAEAISTDPRERALEQRFVLGILRNLSVIDALIEDSRLVDRHKTPEPVGWVIRLAVFEKIFQAGAPDYAIGQQAVALARIAGKEPAGRFVNYVVRRLLPKLPASPEALAADPFVSGLAEEVRLSIPRPVLLALTGGYGEAGLPVARALAAAEPPLWLRINMLKTSAAEIAATGLPVEPGPLPESVRWVGEDERPWSTEPWMRGELTVQDLGAMLAARLLDPAPGSRVADLCAAPGGKTGHLWELMDGQGRLVAAEIDPVRRKLLAESLERLYGPEAGIELADDLAAGADASFSRVLVDAPCQALGLIARHPEVRWDNRLKQREPVLRTQRQVLEQASAWVAPGGRLLWVTCSPTRAENESIVGPWLADRPGWRLLDPTPILAQIGATAWTRIEDGFVRTRPDLVPCDGFALVLLERQA